MPRELSILELSRLVEELNTASGLFIDQFYEIETNRFRIKIGRADKKTNISIELPNYIILTDTAEIKEEATNFAIAVRKRISGAFIKSFALYNRDRIIKITLSRKDEEVYIILEMFGKGNMIIADSKMQILLVYRSHEFSDRSLKTLEKYAPPKNETADVFNEGEIEYVFNELRSGEETSLANYLLRKLGIGSLYIKDAIIRADLDPKVKIKDVKQGGLNSVESWILNLISSSSKSEVLLYFKDGIPIDLSICELLKYKDLERKSYASISAAIEILSANKPITLKVNDEIERLKQSLSKQQSIIGNIEIESQNAKKAGEFISLNAKLINNAISYLKENKAATEKELESILLGFKTKIDKKRKVFTIVVDEK